MSPVSPDAVKKETPLAAIWLSACWELPLRPKKYEQLADVSGGFDVAILCRTSSPCSVIPRAVWKTRTLAAGAIACTISMSRAVSESFE
jgi:hypothetical protein